MDFNTKGYEDLELSTQILIKEALGRGIAVDVLDRNDNFIRLRKGDRVEYIKQATRTSADTYIAPLIMENKQVTKEVLNEKGLVIPGGDIYYDRESALKDVDKYRGKAVVVKPNSTNFGKGVVILGADHSTMDFENAVGAAFEYDGAMLIEQFISGKEYRFLIIGDQTRAVLHRVSANVTGDGRHTIADLIDIKNTDPLRGTGYKTPLEKIRKTDMERDYLRLQGKDFDYIPTAGEIVYLRKNSNISTGGDSIDFTDDVHESYKEIAVKAAKAVGAKICGADIVINDVSQSATSENYGIIELNFNPALHIHNFPYQGKNRHVEHDVLTLLNL